MLRDDNEMITDDVRFAKLFIEHYIYIVKRSSGLNPEKTVCDYEDFDKRIVLHNIIKKYEHYSRIIEIKNYVCEKSLQF